MGLLEDVLKLLQQAPLVPGGTDGTASQGLDACHPALVRTQLRCLGMPTRCLGVPTGLALLC